MILTESSTSPGGFSYALAYNLDETNFEYPGDFVIVRYVATLTGDNFPEGVHTVNFPTTTVITIPDEEPLYATVAEADAYFLLTLNAELWNGFSIVQKTRGLYMGSNDIDQEQYMGYKNSLTSANNRRQFPRILPEHSGLFNIDTEGLPELVKQACMEQALYLMRHLPESDPNDRRDLQQAGLTGAGHGRSSESWDIERAANDRLCAIAREKLRPFFAVGVEPGFGIGAGFGGYGR